MTTPKRVHVTRPEIYLATLRALVTKFEKVRDRPGYVEEVRHPAQTNLEAIQWAIDQIDPDPDTDTTEQRGRGPDEKPRKTK